MLYSNSSPSATQHWLKLKQQLKSLKLSTCLHLLTAKDILQSPNYLLAFV